tara:strand:+ start:403 stop:714 length:312 start_codon:yes stop_codon:yes gene_type:complete
MNIWVFQGVFEGELFSSTHLTYKGALITAILDMCEFFGIDENPEAAIKRYSIDPKTAKLVADADALRLQKRPKLVDLFREMAEHTWDNDYGYQVELIKTQLRP